jgi:hypothetical protein
MRSLHLAVLITLVSGCSTQPQRVPPSPVVAGTRTVQSGTDQVTTNSSQLSATAEQTHAQTGSPAASPAAASPAASTPPALAVDADLVRRGYTPAMFHGQRVYCRTASVTGSRFTQKVCMTKEQIHESERSVKDFLNAPRPDGDCAVMKCN